MEDLEFPENDIDWNDLFTKVFDSSAAKTNLESNQQLLENFFSDVPVNSFVFGDTAAATDKNPNVSVETAHVSSEEEKASDGSKVNTNNEDNKTRKK
ncbi:hypothetical protein QYF36_007659 [Acer negundo]|nr:hypothetical protein QYF36_007659 [Acer negundo]